MAYETIVQAFWDRVKRTPERPAIMHKVHGSYRKVIWREHGRVVELVAGGLLNLGVKPGDNVAIISQSRPHWTWSDIAIMSTGAATVPIYPTLATPEVGFLVRHSDVVGAFVENERQMRKILDMPDLPERFRFVVLFDGTCAGDQRIICKSWDDLLKDGEVFLPGNPDALPRRIDALKPSDLATIVYTSGTTGVPKGVMLVHGNLTGICESLSGIVGLKADDLSLSFLPLSHVYERVGGQCVAIYDGVVMAYAEAIETVPANMVEVRPTVLNGVPRFFEKAYQRIQAEIRHLPKPQQYLIRWALALGRRAAKHSGGSGKEDDLVKQIYKAELRVADRLVFSRIRRRFGGRLRIMVSGAAPLAEEVQLFFEIIGLPIVEGYGLTETSAPVACNVPEDNRRGTVGRPLPGIEVKIAEDGEIMVRGPSVFKGYYKNEEATRQALQDGWFLTGDIGEIDAEGFLKITDRKKDIIITAGGKHIAPQAIENMFKGEGLISHILVYGDRRKFVSALITLNRDGVKAFADSNSIAYGDPDELVHHQRIRQEVEAVVNRKNEELASFERIKKFVILEDDFTIESDELTPTFKVKRKVITQKYQKLLDSFYDVEDLELEGHLAAPE